MAQIKHTASFEAVTHADGKAYQVFEGHLLVFSGSQSRSDQQVAVYAPGAWKNAVVKSS